MVVTDTDKRIVFGWANVIKTADGRVVFDRQGDFVTLEDELEKMAYSYVLTCRDGGEMHLNKGIGTVVESMVFTEEKLGALGIEKGTVPVGWWIGFQIHDEGVWQKIKKGEYSAFSIHGSGRRVKRSLRRADAHIPNRDWMDKLKATLLSKSDDICTPADLSKSLSAKQHKQRVDAAKSKRKGGGASGDDSGNGVPTPKGGDYRSGTWYNADGSVYGKAETEDGPITPVKKPAATKKKRTTKKKGLAEIRAAFDEGRTVSATPDKISRLAHALGKQGFKIKVVSDGSTVITEKGGKSITLKPKGGK